MNPYLALLLVLVIAFGHNHTHHTHTHTEKTEYVVIDSRGKHVHVIDTGIDFGDACTFRRGSIDVMATNPLGTTVRTTFAFRGLTPNQVRRRIIDDYYFKWIPTFGAYGGVFFVNKAREHGVHITLGGEEHWEVRPIVDVRVSEACY